jgi:hypothetical protein
VTDHLDVFQFSSKGAYALDLKNGNEDGATRGGYLNSSLAQVGSCPMSLAISGGIIVKVALVSKAILMIRLVVGPSIST